MNKQALINPIKSSINFKLAQNWIRSFDIVRFQLIGLQVIDRILMVIHYYQDSIRMTDN